MNLKEVEKLCGSGMRRGRFTMDAMKVLAEEVIDKFRLNNKDSILFLSISGRKFESFYQFIPMKDVPSKIPQTIFKYSDQSVILKWKRPNTFILAIADGHKSALLYAEEHQEFGSFTTHADVLYDTILTVKPASIERFLRALCEQLLTKNKRKEVSSALAAAIPKRSRPSDWKYLGFNAAQDTNLYLRESLNTLTWTRFGFLLEEKLGGLLEPEVILQDFCDFLKEQLAYDYLEIAFIPNKDEIEPEPANWIRNDTGLGGKLLSVILNEPFQRGLPQRKKTVIVKLEKCDNIIENPELLRVMNLTRGILVPLLQNERAHGVMMLFFQKEIAITTELQAWLIISGSVLYRALHRAWKYQAAQKMATIDGLTGLYNHRYFMDQLRKEFTRARRYRNWLSLIIADIDHFKHYNDNNGHLAGDRVLVRVAQTIRKTVREIDLVARWGGEEFALLLPENNLKNGMIVAEKIRKEVEALRFKNERKQPSGKLTISLGVAQNSPDLKTYRDMFKRADQALYQAKHEGRNRCVPSK